MKFKKIISTSITFSLLLSNYFSNISLANSTHYEYVNDKILNIRDTFSEDINEIEVFGETTQNPNLLSDIESVGDLYVDSKGNPILDKHGNKQYIVKLTSRNINLLNEKDILQGVHDFNIGVAPTFRESDIRLTLALDKVIPVRPNTTITCKSNKFNFGMAQLSHGLTVRSTGWRQNSVTITTDPQTTHIALNISKGSSPAGTEEVKPEDILPGDIMIYYGDEAIDLYESISNEIEIILPHQLQKVGDVSDKLYYDNKSNSFVIEKNIEDLTVNGDEDWYIVNNNTANTMQFGVYSGFDFVQRTRVLSDRFIQNADMTIGQDKEAVSILNNSKGIPTLYIRINKDKLSTVDANGFKSWLKANNTLVKYKLSSPKMSRVYVKDNTLKFYDKQTNIFVNTPNSTQPNIKVKVNRLNNMAIDAVDEAIANSSVENIDIARDLVNQMEDSALKDSLQDKLNKIYDIPNLEFEKKSATVNADLYIKSKNTLSLGLNTNSIQFEDFNGIEDLEINNGVAMSIESSLPYEIKTYLTSPIQNKDKTITLNPNIISIKEDTDNNYNTFTGINSPIILSDNNPAGILKVHNLDIRLNGGLLHNADIYKTTIKLEVNQK